MENIHNLPVVDKIHRLQDYFQELHLPIYLCLSIYLLYQMRPLCVHQNYRGRTHPIHQSKVILVETTLQMKMGAGSLYEEEGKDNLAMIDFDAVVNGEVDFLSVFFE